MDLSPDLAEVDGGAISTKSSLFAYLKPHIYAHPNNTAVIAVHHKPDYQKDLVSTGPPGASDGGSPTCLQWTYAQIQHAALKLVASLQQQGLGPGSRIVTLIPNGIEWALMLWSAILGKFTLCALDVGALGKARSAELHSLLTMLEPAAVFAPDMEGASAVDVALSRHQAGKVTKVCLSSDTVKDGWTDICTLAAKVPDQSEISRITAEAEQDDPERVQLIFFTSGTTTGRPKGCPNRVKSRMHVIEAQIWGSHNDASARNVLQTANFRIIAPALALATWAAGACIVMPGPSFQPSAILDAIEIYKARLLVLIPAMIHALAAQPRFSGLDKSSLRTVFVGGDMVTEGTYEKVCEAFPHCEIMNGYGSTEGGAIHTFETMGKIGKQQLSYLHGIAPFGKVAPGCRWRIADDENKPLRRDEIGEIHICSSAYIEGYLNGEQPEDFYTDEHGSWFKTGDMGQISREGFLYMTGRKKDIIKRAGIPIAPAALESVIDTFLQTQSSVLGIQDKVLGQVPFAVAQSLNGKTVEEVKQQVVDVVGKDYAIAGISTLDELGLSAFPLNATGKVLKRELEGPVLQYMSRMQARI